MMQRSVRITPEWRPKVDLTVLAGALIDLAERLAEKEQPTALENGPQQPVSLHRRPRTPRQEREGA